MGYARCVDATDERQRHLSVGSYTYSLLEDGRLGDVGMAAPVLGAWCRILLSVQQLGTRTSSRSSGPMRYPSWPWRCAVAASVASAGGPACRSGRRRPGFVVRPAEIQSVRRDVELHPMAKTTGSATTAIRAHRRRTGTARSMTYLRPGRRVARAVRRICSASAALVARLVQHARWTTTAGRRLVGGQVLSTIVPGRPRRWSARLIAIVRESGGCDRRPQHQARQHRTRDS